MRFKCVRVYVYICECLFLNYVGCHGVHGKQANLRRLSGQLIRAQ